MFHLLSPGLPWILPGSTYLEITRWLSTPVLEVSGADMCREWEPWYFSWSEPGCHGLSSVVLSLGQAECL